MVARISLLLSVSISAFGYEPRLDNQASSAALEAIIPASRQDPLLMRRQSLTARTDESEDSAALADKNEEAEFSEQLQAARQRGDSIAAKQLQAPTKSELQRKVDDSLTRLQEAMNFAKENIDTMPQIAPSKEGGLSLIEIDGDGGDAAGFDDSINSDSKDVTRQNEPSALHDIAALAHQASEEASVVSAELPGLNYSVTTNKLKNEAHEHIWRAMHLFPPDNQTDRAKGDLGDAIARLTRSAQASPDDQDDEAIPTQPPSREELREQGLAHLKAAEDAFPVPPKKAAAEPSIWQQVEKQASEALKLTRTTSDLATPGTTVQSQPEASAVVQLSEDDTETPSPLPLFMNETALRLAAANTTLVSFADSAEEVRKRHEERTQDLQDASLILDEAIQELDTSDSLARSPMPLSTGPSGAELLRKAVSGVPRPPTAAEKLEEQLKLLHHQLP